MTNAVHNVSFVLNRNYLFPQWLGDKDIRPWVDPIADAVRTGKRNSKLVNGLCQNAFIDHLGPFKYRVPRRTVPPALNVKYSHSSLSGEPFYIPCTWKIRFKSPPVGFKSSFRLRCRLQEHGGATVTLHGQFFSPKGIPLEDLCSLLRSISDEKPAHPAIFETRAMGTTTDETALSILEKAGKLLAAGLFQTPPPDLIDGSGTLKPDFLLIDIGRASPPFSLPPDDELLARLLMLDMNPKRVIAHTRKTELGWNVTDWVGANSRRMVFCDTDRPWPILGRVQRTTRRRAEVLWRFNSVVELVRFQKMWAQKLSIVFESATLSMSHAKSVDADFISTLLKANFYNKALVVFATDLPHVSTQLFGRDTLLYNHLADMVKLPDEEKRLQDALKNFLAAAEKWKPGIMNLLDLFKLLPKFK